MKKILFHEKFHSSWVIMLMDLLVIIVSLLIALGLEHHSVLQPEYRQFSFFYLFTTIIVFLASQVHNRIIRYANTEDILRIFYTILIGNLIFIGFGSAATNSLELSMREDFLSILLVNFFISSSLLVGLRLVIKVIYGYINNSGNTLQKENVLIYGSANPSISIKRALDAQRDLPICIKGFVDCGSDAINKQIEQINVYPINSIERLKKQFDIKKLMVTAGGLMEDGKKRAVSGCIALDIQVITVPPPDQWINGQPNIHQFKNLKIEDLLERQPIELCKKQVYKDIKGKRVLVTGAAGSIGSELVRQILGYDPEYVILCDQAETPLHDIKLEIEDGIIDPKKVVFFVADIRNKIRLEALFDIHQPHLVFHSAAYKHVPMMEDNPIEAVLTNVKGTKNLADASLAHDVEKFIMISTDKAVRPTNVMGATKRIAEMYIQSLNLYLHELNNHSGKHKLISKKTKFITTRFGNVLGSNGSVIPRFQAQIERGGPITVTHPDITRYFMTIPEAVQLVLEAAVMGKGGEIFLFDMGKPIKICDLAINMIKLAGLIPYQDIDVVFSGLRPGEKLYEELLNDNESVLPTHHKDIKISKTIPQNHENVAKMVNELLKISKLNDPHHLVAKMKSIVPGFISNNSIYEKLDNHQIIPNLLTSA
ncbi:MAG: polysaccharide biosynthesis protein [Pedobacter sp.]|nr:MAG: polysaccharide biosynthesis protein [Pedobacter sp.]